MLEKKKINMDIWKKWKPEMELWKVFLINQSLRIIIHFIFSDYFLHNFFILFFRLLLRNLENKIRNRSMLWRGMLLAFSWVRMYRLRDPWGSGLCAGFIKKKKILRKIKDHSHSHSLFLIKEYFTVLFLDWNLSDFHLQNT